MLIILTIIGCGKQEEVISVPSPPLSDSINEERVSDEECPEGYVYDYQVSMEPIPEEIAALGGDVCGTIHAYPTRIKIALAKQEIENDVELQKQNEKNIEGVKQYLADTYGGEFEIEPLTTGIWSYMCTEKNTDKENVVYISPLYGEGRKEDIITADNYYYEVEAEKYQEIIGEVIESVMQEKNVYKIFLEQVGASTKLKLYMAIFCDNVPDYLEEQRKILEIYESMIPVREDYESDITIQLTLTYFPIEYQQIIMQQYERNIDEFTYIYGKTAEKLIQIDELYSQFCIESDEGVENILDEVLRNKEIYYENEYIFENWRWN